MRIDKIGVAAVAALGALTLGGCAYDNGYGYGGYPYGGVSVGVGYGGGGYYGNPYYSGYDGYGSPFGWYDDFYYPGTGIYVYDSYRRPHRWNDTQRRYWSQRSGTRTNTSGSRWTRTNTTQSTTRPNWSGFSSGSSTGGRHHHR